MKRAASMLRVAARLLAWLAVAWVFAAILESASDAAGEADPLAAEQKKLEQQRREVAAALAKSEVTAQQARQRDLAEEAVPPGLVILVPPAAGDAELVTVQAEQVPFKLVLRGLARQMRLAVTFGTLVDNETLGMPVTVDLRLAPVDEALEIIAGIVGLNCQTTRGADRSLGVLISRDEIADPAERQASLREAAVAVYTRVLIKYPDGDRALEAAFRIAQAHYDQGEYALAAQDYKLFLERDKQNKHSAEALLQLGRCYSNVGDYPAASKALYGFLDRSPDAQQAAEALLALGRAAAKAGETADALTAYRRLLLDYPSSSVEAQALAELAGVLFDQKDYQGALEHYVQLRRAYPQFGRRAIAWRLALCKLGLEQWESVAGDLAALLAEEKTDPIAADCYFALAESLDKRGGQLEAVEAYVGALDRFPAHADAPAARARVVEQFRALGLLERAAKFAEEALKQDDSQVGLKTQFALVLLDLKDYDRALGLFEQLSQADGSLSKAETLNRAGECAHKLNRYDRAEALYRGALNGDPNQAERRTALLGLGDSFLARGDYKRAARAYQGFDGDEPQQ